MANFTKEVSLAAGWNNILTLMQANGFNGFPIGQGTLREVAGDLLRYKFGHTSRTVAPVSVSDGIAISSRTESFVDSDMALGWLYAPTGGETIEIKFSNGYD